jgi:hypothetical protein
MRKQQSTLEARGWHHIARRAGVATAAAAAAHLLARADRRVVVANVAPARGSLELLDLQGGTSGTSEGDELLLACAVLCCARGCVPRA